jgi:hypothetical protein
MAETFTQPIHLPVGTPAEVEAQGWSLDVVASCAQQNKASGIRGCPYWERCMFGRKSMGGFKGKGPHYIGYYMKTSVSDGAKQKEDLTSCYAFVHGLQNRMLAGMDRQNRGMDHEVIRVIAQEGEEILYTKSFAEDPKNPKSKIVEITAPMKVPAFLRPGENPETTRDQKLAARAKRRAQLEADVQDMVTEELMQAREPVDADDLVDTGSVLAQPVKEKAKK